LAFLGGRAAGRYTAIHSPRPSPPPMPRLPLALLLIVPATAAADRLDFNRDVRPILSDKCFACHGPDKSKRKADLRLDTPAGKAVVVPGELANSELVKRITSTDKDEMMPPPSSG